MSAFVGYIIGVASSAAGYLAYRWLSNISNKLDKQDEIVRILDYIGVEDEIYPLFKPKHLPQLRLLEKFYDTVEMFECLDWYVELCARMIVMDQEHIDMLTSELPCMMLTWSPDNILSTARELAKLDLNTQTIENAASSLDNFDKYNSFLGERSLIMSAYLNNPKFSALIDRVIYPASENDDDSFEHISIIVQKINNVVFGLVINLASEINKPQSETVQMFEMFNTLYSKFLTYVYELRISYLESIPHEPPQDTHTQQATNDANQQQETQTTQETQQQETQQQETQQATNDANIDETNDATNDANNDETIPMSDIDDLPSITA